MKIYLPRSTGKAEQASDLLASTPVEGGSETILVVEDDVLVRKYVLAQVASLGYSTLEAANAAEALKIIDNGAHGRPAVHRRDHARRHERPPARGRGAQAPALR